MSELKLKKVEELKNEDMSYEFSVTIGSSDIRSYMDHKLLHIGEDADIKGFRKGKAPITVLRSMYDDRIMGEVIQNVVQETSETVLKDKDITPAMQPRIEIKNFAKDEDLVYHMNFERMPDMPSINYKDIHVTSYKVSPSEEAVDTALKDLAKGMRHAKTLDDGSKAESGDVVVIDYLGKVDDVPFAGGEAQKHPLELGSGSFIPGFEDQLIGVKSGDKVDVKVTFPTPYHSADLEGKDAVFEVVVHEVRRFEDRAIDDDLAKGLGLEDLATLKDRIKEHLSSEYNGQVHYLMKKELLDKVYDACSFDIPAKILSDELDVIVREVKEREPEHKDTDEGELKEEYKDIARRRVALGLFLAHFGQENKVEVTEQDMRGALQAQMARLDEQSRMQFMQYYQSNPNALASLRAPVFEEKVVQLLLALVTQDEKEVTGEDLMELVEKVDAEMEGDKPKAKKSAPKKATKKDAAKKEGDSEGKEEKPKAKSTKKAAPKKTAKTKE